MKGAALRTIRRKLGLSQNGLAKQLGVWPNTVARWELDKRAIPEPVAILAKRLASESV